MPPRIEQLSTGNQYTPEQVVLAMPDPKTALVATDADDTMSIGDTGILIFIYELLDRKFWHLAPNDFREILLPKNYEDKIRAIAKNQLHPKQSRAQLIFNLRDDLYQIYKIKHELHDSASVEGADDTGLRETLDSLSREFAAKMLAFDRIMMELEGTFLNEMNGQLLMRIRFLTGKTASAISKKMQEVTESTLPPEIKLDDWNEGLKRKVTQAEIDSRDLIANTRLLINKQVLAILKQAQAEGAAVRVISTNKKAIIEEFLKQTPFSDIVHKDRHAATDLHHEEGVYNGETNATPVFGPEKVKRVKAIEKLKSKKRIPRKCQMALGDSITNDGPMLRYALMNGGIACVIIRDEANKESTIARIKAEILNDLPSEAANRVFLVIGEDAQVIHSPVST